MSDGDSGSDGIKQKIDKTEDLRVFEMAHELTLNLYKITEKFLKNEMYSLISQIRRASSSICANIMEGSHRNNSLEFKQFVGIANGSVGELKYYLLLSKDLGYITFDEYNKLIDNLNIISKMLRALSKSLKLKTNTNTKKLKEYKSG